MTRRSPRFAACILTAALALALSTSGCAVAYKRALERGDALAQAGDWDAAAASYEQASRLEPDRDEARSRLRGARRRQAARRVSTSRALLEQGKLAEAVIVASEAARLDPQSQEVRQAYVDARGRALAKAEALLAEDKPQDGLALTGVVRRCDPNDRQAYEIEGRLLDRIAARAYDRGLAFSEGKKKGNALLALREAQGARPGYRDAAARAEAIQRELEAEIRFYLVIARADGPPQSGVDARVEADLLRWKPDAHYRLIAVSARQPSPGAQGVRITPKIGPIAPGHEMQTLARSCDYVCGTDRVQNPDYDVASRKVAEAEARARAADGEIKRAKRVVAKARRERDEQNRVHDGAEAALRRARAERDGCIFTKALTDCKPLEDQLAEAQRAHDAANSRLDELQVALRNAEQELSSAEFKKDNAQRDWQRSLGWLKTTPTTMAVDRVCTHNYGVSVHTFTASVSLALRAHVLGEPKPVDLPPTTHAARSIDEAFPPESGRCAAVAAGDPLTAPALPAVEAALSARVVEEIQSHVGAWYSGYVDTYKTDYETAKATGRVEDANEAYVRYLLVGPGLPP
jgi:tetratricopeptide (TPR) repeat protein